MQDRLHGGERCSVPGRRRRCREPIEAGIVTVTLGRVWSRLGPMHDVTLNGNREIVTS